MPNLYIMGLDYHIARAIKLLAPLGHTMTVGRQNWWCIPHESRKLGLKWQPEYGRAVYAEPFFKELGATCIESYDIVADESPTFVHDLTQPVTWCHNKYDTIIDLGTAEHIADQVSYWRNLHSLLVDGGRLIVCLPANQHCGHGLYQFSPEFFFNMGGYCNSVWTVEYGWNVQWRRFSKTETRFEYRNRKPTYVFAILTKITDFSMPTQDATTTHCPVIPFAKHLLRLPFVRNLQRWLA